MSRPHPVDAGRGGAGQAGAGDGTTRTRAVDGTARTGAVDGTTRTGPGRGQGWGGDRGPACAVGRSVGQSDLRPRFPGREATHARTVSAYQ